MLLIQNPTVALYGIGSLLAFAFALWIIRRRAGKIRQSKSVGTDLGAAIEVFSLAEDGFFDANFHGRKALAQIDSELLLDDDDRLRRLLSARFDNVDSLLAAHDVIGDFAAVSRDGHLQAVRETAGKDVRIEIRPRGEPAPGARDVHSLDADTEELRMLRVNTQIAPFLLWRQNKAGEVVWANKRYIETATEAFGKSRMSAWPIPSIFTSLDASRSSGNHILKRVQTSNDQGTLAWFDCHMTDIGDDTLCTAFPADEAVQSETRRQEFTQTLTKTFSDLSIGLAIFDKSRLLNLFNPALSDLTALPPDFLTARPSLASFLDQLRERRVMPEPRDYRSWRQSMSDLEEAAVDGTYFETWSLPDGQTYRVTGRPHPDGALAFLFEDISAEMSLTRRFRAQLEQSQSVIDALEDAVAIFSASGEMTFSNAAYKTLFRSKAESADLGSTVVEATRDWHDQTVPNPVWGDFRDFALQGGERTEWVSDVTMRDGRALACRFVPQKAGASLAVFRLNTATKPTAEELRQVG